jgi:pimeloyl-ACP methyl ester carboxylesterase
LSKLNQRMKLPDGRMLGFDEYGMPEGKPLFHFHGTPSSRLEWPLFGNEAMAQALNIRLIVADRPGIGLSDFQTDRRITDWPKDVAALADHLGVERFAILGYSGGAPFAAACALAMPERLTKVGLVSGLAPFDQPGLMNGISAQNRRFWDLVRDKPRLSRLALRMMGLMVRFAGNKMVAGTTAALPEPDQQTVTRPEFRQGFLKGLQETLRQGPHGVQRDSQLIVSSWGFRPQDIHTHVQLWHGQADENAPIAMAQYMADAIPNSHLEVYPGEGHLSLSAKYTEQFLRSLAT